MELDMKWNRIIAFILLAFQGFFPLSCVLAAEIKPDIRTSELFVKKRKMPQTCGYTLEEWIAMYVGYNKIPDYKIKFYSDLAPDSSQLERATIRLTPYSVRTNMQFPMDEPGNKPSWNGSICYYSEAGNGQIESQELIVSEDAIPESTKKLRWGAELLAAEIARAHVQLTGSTYNMKKEDIAPNPNNPRSCSEKPPGAKQEDKKDTNSGENPFNWSLVNDYTLDALCSIPGNPCNCVMTEMWIKPDSTNQYASYTGCTLAGCKNEEKVQQAVMEIDPKSRADENAINSGGLGNVFRPGLMQILFEFVEKILGHSAGFVEDQATKNNITNPVEPASWSFTKEWEVALDFINCKLFPFAKRDQMQECNKNWLAGLIENITEQLQAEPIQPISTESAIFPAP
jgi:hypothetical protein